MGDEISDTVNLNLNLGPDPELGLDPATNDAAMELTDWANGLSFGESGSLRSFRSPHHRSPSRQINILPVLAETYGHTLELSQLLINSANGAALPTGEGSIVVGERVSEDLKKCENGNGLMDEESVTDEKRVIEKSIGNDGSFFDCFICLDLSKDPVVTNCGHLYCWSCLYQWLHVSDAKECPVCKGAVSVKTLTPIYGRGRNKRGSEELSDTKIPPRPQARRIESLRNSLHRSGYIPTEMIRHLQDRLERESSSGERRARPFINRFMSSRGVRAEQNQSSEALVAPLDDINGIDLISNIVTELEEENESRDMSNRRQIQAQRHGRMLSYSPTLTNAERLVDSYLMFGRNQEQSNNPQVGVEDRDSFSSIVGVINQESQVEIDSMLTISTSSSVRRHENGSRVSDVDSAESRRPRRRRRRLA